MTNRNPQNPTRDLERGEFSANATASAIDNAVPDADTVEEVLRTPMRQRQLSSIVSTNEASEEEEDSWSNDGITTKLTTNANAVGHDTHTATTPLRGFSSNRKRHDSNGKNDTNYGHGVGFETNSQAITATPAVMHTNPNRHMNMWTPKKSNISTPDKEDNDTIPAIPTLRDNRQGQIKGAFPPANAVTVKVSTAQQAAAALATLSPQYSEADNTTADEASVDSTNTNNTFNNTNNNNNGHGIIPKFLRRTSSKIVSDRNMRDQVNSFRYSRNRYNETLQKPITDDPKTTEDLTLPRLVLRDRAFQQSSNKVHIEHNQGYKIYALLKHNWFHVLLRMKTKRSLLLLLSIWTGAILVFAGVYMKHDNLIGSTNRCGLGIEGEQITLAAAFAFSLETCTTVGYGLPNGVNSFFQQGCTSLQIIIYIQMVWSLVFNAFLITFLYNRVGRSEARSTQVLFSDKALVSVVDGQIRFQIRIFDCDSTHPVVEAHARLYCVLKHRPVPRPLRLLQPDDELGGMMFLSFPSVITHSIDLYSLLHPPTAFMMRHPRGLVLRQVDGSTASRDDVVCPICGESYGTFKRWKHHIEYSRIVEEQEDYPLVGTHRSIDLGQLDAQPGTEAITDLDELKRYFQENVSEVLCVLEGIDPMQSGTFQALQSYQFDDIVWESYAQFAPCLTVSEETNSDRVFVVDLDRYHDIVANPESEAAAAAAAEAAKEDIKFLICEEARQGGSTTRKGSSSSSSRAKRRHRRVKTLSNRPGDSLFAPGEPSSAPPSRPSSPSAVINNASFGEHSKGQ